MPSTPGPTLVEKKAAIVGPNQVIEHGLVQKPLVLGALDSLESELVQEQRAKAQPKTRRFELNPR
jgi:hypothetical protein